MIKAGNGWIDKDRVFEIPLTSLYPDGCWICEPPMPDGHIKVICKETKQEVRQSHKVLSSPIVQPGKYDPTAMNLSLDVTADFFPRK